MGPGSVSAPLLLSAPCPSGTLLEFVAGTSSMVCCTRCVSSTKLMLLIGRRVRRCRLLRRQEGQTYCAVALMGERNRCGLRLCILCPD